MLRVAHLCGSFSPISETFIYDYIRTEASFGIQTLVITGARANAHLFPMEGVVEARLRRWSPGWLWSKGKAAAGIDPGIWPLSSCADVTKTLREFGPDVVHAHFGQVGAASVAIAGGLGVPLLVSFHGRDAFALPGRPRLEPLYGAMWKSRLRYTAVSEYMKAELVRLGCEREAVSVIHVGIDPDLFAFRKPRQQGGVVRFICVGRMVEKKGFTDAVRCVALARAEGADVELTLIGDGPQMPEVKRLVKSSGLASIVRLLGARPRSQVIEEMRSSDAFLLASKTASDGDKEGIPTVIMEAQFIGLPVVSTRHSGIPEAIPEPNRRFLAAEGDPEDLARCILKLLDCRDSWTEIARLGRAHVEEKFHLHKETRKLVELYAEMVGGIAPKGLETPPARSRGNANDVLRVLSNDPHGC
jgi:colanic acid/amylovoran biosynthesis glycosyltransferase